MIEWGVSFINVTFTKREDKNTFNRIESTCDRELFTKKSADVLKSFRYNPENTKKTALSLLPDILDYDYSHSKGYLKVRNLTDNVIDAQVAVLTNSQVTTDKVGHHQDICPVFPYLGPPHPTA